MITPAVEAYVEDQRPGVPVSGGREQASDRGRAISRRNTSGSSPPSTGGTSPSAPVSPLPISCVAILRMKGPTPLFPIIVSAVLRVLGKLIRWCGRRDSNPHTHRARDFKSRASTNFATSASRATKRMQGRASSRP